MRTASRAIGRTVLACAILVLGTGLAGAAGPLALITPEEAARPTEAAAIAMRGITRGPGIELMQPQPGKAQAGQPLPFEVRFEPHNGTKIDPSSVKVTYLKQPEVDLTPRLKAYISERGIDVADAALPSGKHPIRIDVKDTEGRESALTVMLSIAP